MPALFSLRTIVTSVTIALALPVIGLANSKLRRVPPPKASDSGSGGGHGAPAHGGGHGGHSAAKPVVNEKLTYAAPEGWQEVPAPKGYLKTYSKPVDDPSIYKASIQIRRKEGPHPIDGIFLDEMKEFLVHKIQSSGSPMRKYEVRSGELLTLPSGRDAILIYADFYLDAEPMMHLHFIVSSADNHYFFTYTDTKAEMENPGVGTTASQVFESFVAVELPSGAPGRFKWPIRIGVGIFSLIALIMILQKVVGRKYSNDHDDGMADDGMADDGMPAQVGLAAAAPGPAAPAQAAALMAQAAPQSQPPSQPQSQPQAKAKPKKKSLFSFGRKSSFEDDFDAEDGDEGEDSFALEAQPMPAEEPFALGSDDFGDDNEEDDWNLADTEKTKIS